jgi:hypothetical protein
MSSGSMAHAASEEGGSAAARTNGKPTSRERGSHTETHSTASGEESLSLDYSGRKLSDEVGDSGHDVYDATVSINVSESLRD